MIARTSFVLALVSFVTFATLGCGATLDLGRDPPVGCEVAEGQRELTTFASLPGFVPREVVSLGNHAYVGGTLEGVSNEGARGRLLRVSLSSGKLEEVWRGVSFAGPLRAFEGRIAFLEHDRDVPFVRGTFGGLHVVDTKTNDVRDVPLGPESDYVSDFELGDEGIVYTAVRLPDGSASSERRSVVRFDGLGTRTVAAHEKRDFRYFRRGTRVMVELAADATESGLDDLDSEGATMAAGSIGERGLTIERRFVELGTYPSVFREPSRIVHANDEFYFVATSPGTTWTTQRVPRLQPAPGQQSLAETFVWSTPTFAGNRAYFVAPFDRAMIRRRQVEGADRVGVEVAFDPRRQVQKLEVDACRILWLSDSEVETASHRLMVAPR